MALIVGGHAETAEARKPKEGAAALDVLGKQAYRQGDYADALAAFEAAYETDPLPRFLFNLGRCHQKLGDMARASHFFERYLETAGEAKDRKEVKALATMLRVKLKKSFSELVVTANVDEALVQVELESGKINGVTPFSYWVPFGQHRVVVTADGREVWTRSVVVKPKKLAKLHAELELERKVATSQKKHAKRTLVGPQASMAYRANPADPGIGGAWVKPGHDDEGWNVGAYGVGYDQRGTPGMLGVQIPAGASSVYTRARFTVDDPARVTRLWFGADYDDGVVAWLNGVEIWRSATMEGVGGRGGPAWDARAADHESSNGDKASIVHHEVTEAGLGALVPGENVLAVGVWNRSAKSSDLVLVPSLKAEHRESARP